MRISTASQKTDRQQEELTSFAELNQLNFNRNLDVFIDVVSGFKDGVERPNFSVLKNRKTTCGGFSPYGYRISEDSRLVINEDEAAIVRKIFSMYLHGEKTVNIKDTLNSEKIPCPYRARQDATNQRRKNKGLGPVEYIRGAIENMLWRRTTIARILRNKVYIGIQTHTFHEPDRANPIPRAKRKGRKVIEKFEIHTPETRIISDEEFYQVDKTFAERMYNRNQGIRRPTMIKDLLRCGECGSHFCAVFKFLGRAYECAAKAGRINVKCLLGPCVLMSKLDGLVLRLCIQKFAQYDLIKKSEGSDGNLFQASTTGRHYVRRSVKFTTFFHSLCSSRSNSLNLQYLYNCLWIIPFHRYRRLSRARDSSSAVVLPWT